MYHQPTDKPDIDGRLYCLLQPMPLRRFATAPSVGPPVSSDCGPTPLWLHASYGTDRKKWNQRRITTIKLVSDSARHAGIIPKG